MRKFVLFGLFLALVVCSYAAGPAQEMGGVIKFTAKDQVTTTPFLITAIAWVSDEGSNLDIAADDDLLIADGSSTEIIYSRRAEAVGDNPILVIPDGISVNGISITTMDGGVVYIYGKQR